MNVRTLLVGVAVVFSGVTTARATPITYTESVPNASVYLGNDLFSGVLVTFRMSTDTTSSWIDSFGYFRNTGILTVTVSGLGTATFTDPVTVFDLPSVPGGIAGFADSVPVIVGVPPLKIVGDYNAAFTSYDLTTSIGPVTGIPNANFGYGFNTTAGRFAWESLLVGDATFIAVTGTPMPEPTSMLLLGTGLIGMGARRWRTCRKRV